MKFEKYQDHANEWRWKLRADNHSDVIADSGEGYKDERDCDHGIALVKSASTAPVILGPPTPPITRPRPLMSSAVKPSQKPLQRPKIS